MEVVLPVGESNGQLIMQMPDGYFRYFTEDEATRLREGQMITDLNGNTYALIKPKESSNDQG